MTTLSPIFLHRDHSESHISAPWPLWVPYFCTVTTISPISLHCEHTWVPYFFTMNHDSPWGMSFKFLHRENTESQISPPSPVFRTVTLMPIFLLENAQTHNSQFPLPYLPNKLFFSSICCTPNICTPSLLYLYDLSVHYPFTIVLQTVSTLFRAGPYISQAAPFKNPLGQYESRMTSSFIPHEHAAAKLIIANTSESQEWFFVVRNLYR